MSLISRRLGPHLTMPLLITLNFSLPLLPLHLALITLLLSPHTVMTTAHDVRHLLSNNTGRVHLHIHLRLLLMDTHTPYLIIR
jgi:hypothetical protein